MVALDVDGYYEQSGRLTDCAWIPRHILAAKEENVTKISMCNWLYLCVWTRKSPIWMVDL